MNQNAEFNEFISNQSVESEISIVEEIFIKDLKNISLLESMEVSICRKLLQFDYGDKFEEYLLVILIIKLFEESIELKFV